MPSHDDPDARDTAMMRTVLSTVPAVVLRVSLGGVIEYVNRVLPEYAGAPLVGQSVYVFAPPDQHEAMRAGLERATSTRQPTTYETVALAPDGTRDWYHTTVGPIIDGGELTGLTLVCVNVTATKEALEKERTTRRWLDVALKAGNVGAWSVDVDADVVSWSDTLCAMFDIPPEQAPRTLAELRAVLPEDLREGFEQNRALVLGGAPLAPTELTFRGPRGTRTLILQGSAARAADGHVCTLFGGVVDITERRTLEAQVRFAQKMEAVGQLSAGIAHNFNNVLAVIVPTLELARARTPIEDRPMLDDALESATRATSLVRQMMDFSRIGTGSGPGEREPLEVAVRRAVDLCRKAFDLRVAVSLAVESGGDAAVDGAQLENAVVNLLLNARDALVEARTPAAQVRVVVRRVPPSALPARIAELDHDWVELAVEDNGPGIAAEVRGRVFDPFFTTKPPGLGTGLGLATVQATAAAHAGFADCVSKPGAGATFSLYLRHTPLPRPDAQSSRPPTRGSGRRVLVVDDEPAVARATSAVLRRAGYDVTTAASGAEAVRIASTQPAELVVLDYSMPGLSAEDAAAQLKSLHPGVVIICYSGLGVSLENADFQLAKPASPRVLLQAVERLMPTTGVRERG
jgi:PAS domain S-box-containing protein